jgi:hypothetical protein
MFLKVSPGPYSVCVLFLTFLSVSRHIPGQTVFVSHFPRFTILSPYSSPTVCISYFSSFSVFLTAF